MNEFFRKILFLPEQASTVAEDIDALHYFVITVTMIGAAVVFLVALVFLVRYRRRGDGKPEKTPRVKAGLRLEATFITLLLTLFILWWVIGYREYVRLQEPPEDAMEVYVTGKQWMWKFAYPEGQASAATLVVPVGKPVKLIMTSRDVIHSFYVPHFRIKQDVLPGRYTTVWFEAVSPGTYPIFCAEYCGLSHSKMTGEVVVLSQRDYANWLEGAASPEAVGAPDVPTGPRPARRDLAERGRAVAAREGCFGCHTVDGRSHIGPTFLGLYGRKVRLQDGSTLIADEGYITESMMDPQAKIVAGYQPVMPTFQGLLHASETAAILAYIKSLKPSGTGAPRGPEQEEDEWRYPKLPRAPQPPGPQRPGESLPAGEGPLQEQIRQQGETAPPSEAAPQPGETP